MNVPEKYLQTLHAEAFEIAHDPEHGGLRLSALTHTMLRHLEDAELLANAQVAYHIHDSGNIAAEVHGYAYDPEEENISLFFCIDGSAGQPLGVPKNIVSVPKAEIDRAFRRLEAFVKLAKSGKAVAIDESQPVAELIGMLTTGESSKWNVELHVLVIGDISDRAFRSTSDDTFRRDVWDLLRLSRAVGTPGNGQLSINFVEDFGGSLPCLVTPKSEDGIRVFLACVPGAMLAELYDTYRSRLLERNVRSFLQFTGKVNKGIRETILNTPGRFLPYNNGLAATATKADIQLLDNGMAKIISVEDFQIVNGGQTTASITACLKRDKASLQHVSVAMKLTIVPADQVSTIVPLISKHANTQNRIQEADFSANHPWHIAMEKLSRITWTKATEDAPRGTQWFYERSRGQYADAQAAMGTPAGRNKFRHEHPPSQKLLKTDVAKHLLSWEQKPAIVSLGGQKCFMQFMKELTAKNVPEPALEDFQRIVALAILFKKTEKLYGELAYTGYRANVVTYAIAWLSHAMNRKLPVADIWARQSLHEDYINPLKTIIRGIREVVVNPPGGRNVTEWCKRPECWSKVMDLRLDAPLPKVGLQDASDTATDPMDTSEEAVILAVTAIPIEVWFAVAKWAKQTNSLKSWQRSLAVSVGKRKAAETQPSIKQAVQSRKLLLEAIALGYTHEGLTSVMIGNLEGDKTYQ